MLLPLKLRQGITTKESSFQTKSIHPLPPAPYLEKRPFILPHVAESTEVASWSCVYC